MTRPSWLMSVYVLPVIAINSGNITRSPFGPVMCKEMCKLHINCWIQHYFEETLMCALIKNGDFRKIRQRTVISRKGRMIVVRVNQERESEKSHPFPKESFKLKSFNMENQDVSIISMTLNTGDPALMYLLLHFRGKRRCYRFLHFVDLHSKTLANNSIALCEKREGNRQIFTGPCTMDGNSGCLYSINSGFKFFITTYKEPSITEEKVVREAQYRYTRIGGGYLLCSLYISHQFLCIEDGKRLYQIRLNPGEIYLTKIHLKWQFECFPGLTDFKGDVGGPTFNAVVVQRALVRLVNVDSKRKIIHTMSSVHTDVVTAILKNEVILLHGEVLGRPFHRCTLRTLEFCNSKQLIKHK